MSGETVAPSFQRGSKSALIPILIFAVVASLSLGGVRGADYMIMHGLNRLSGRSAILDHAIFGLTKDMFSSVVLLSLVVYAWYGTLDAAKRAGILVGVFMSFASGIISRVLQLLLPTHHRPLHDAALHFRIPFGVQADTLNHWASFPSDHAAVTFGLACTLYLANIRVGRVAFALVALLNLVRIYLGLHYPSDVLAGGMLGIALVVTTRPFQDSRIVRGILAWEFSHRALFYALAFYLCFGIATLFNDYRSALADIAKMVVPHS